MTVEEITSNAEYRKATNLDGVVLIDAYATWCQPCKTISPHLEKMSESDEYSHVKFYKFDIEKVPDVAHELGVSSVPNFSIFKDGMIEEGVNGADVKKLEAAIKSVS